MKKLFKETAKQIAKGNDLVLVSVIASSGSTPRGTGAKMLINKNGRVIGTVGGGAVEYRSEQIAAEVLKERKSKTEFFRLKPNQVADIGMICGGDVLIWFQYLRADDKQTLEILDAIELLQKQREQSWLFTEITPECQTGLIIYSETTGLMGFDGTEAEAAALVEKLDHKSGKKEINGRKFQIEPLVQAGKVYIFGGGHVAQELVPTLARVHFHCVVMDDRAEFAKPELFLGVEETIHGDFNQINEILDIHENDFAVVMTRGHKDDQLVQEKLLKTPAYYIGVIGSARKTKAVFGRLKEKGFTDEDLQRITTPIGLDIKSETPAEIAVSIAAQMIMRRAEMNNC
ncbi:MAG: XdhC family protein [Bacillota bacterium]|jgi:xanthine dehydrogenase accessory factor